MIIGNVVKLRKFSFFQSSVCESRKIFEFLPFSGRGKYAGVEEVVPLVLLLTAATTAYSYCGGRRTPE